MQPRDGGLEAVRRARAYRGRYRREAVGAALALLLVVADFWYLRDRKIEMFDCHIMLSTMRAQMGVS